MKIFFIFEGGSAVLNRVFRVIKSYPMQLVNSSWVFHGKASESCFYA